MRDREEQVQEKQVIILHELKELELIICYIVADLSPVVFTLHGTGARGLMGSEKARESSALSHSHHPMLSHLVLPCHACCAT